MPALFDATEHLRSIAALYRADEGACLERLFPAAQLEKDAYKRAVTRATRWIEDIRHNHRPSASVSDLLARFGLDSGRSGADVPGRGLAAHSQTQRRRKHLSADKLDAAHWDKASASEPHGR